MPGGGFNSHDVMQLTGVSARQLQWWDEHRLIVPAREGRKRVYSASDLMDILVVLELRRRHISLQQVRRVLDFLRKQLHVRPADLVSAGPDRPLPDYHLLIDGKNLYLETDTRQIFDLLKSTEQAVFLISLKDTVKKLLAAGNTLTQTEVFPARKPVTQATRVGKERVARGAL